MKYYTAIISDIDHPVLSTFADGAKEAKQLLDAAQLLGHKYIIAAGEQTGEYIKGFMGLAATSTDQIEDAIEYVSERMSQMKLPTGEWAVFMENSEKDCDDVYKILKTKFNGTSYNPNN